MADIILWFINSTKVTFPDADDSVEALTELYTNAMQNDQCKTLTVTRPTGSHIIQKRHVLMIEVR